MSGQRLYGLPAPVIVTTNASGLAAVTWPAFTAVPSVQVTIENDSTTLGAFADVLKGSVTKTGCTVRAWRLQLMNTLLIAANANPATPLAGATIHVRPWGTLA